MFGHLCPTSSVTWNAGRLTQFMGRVGTIVPLHVELPAVYSRIPWQYFGINGVIHWHPTHKVLMFFNTSFKKYHSLHTIKYIFYFYLHFWYLVFL